MIEIKEGSIITPIPTDEEYKERIKYWGVIPPASFKEFVQKYNCAIPIGLEIKVDNRLRYITRFLGMIRKEVSNFNNRYYDIGCLQSTIFEFMVYDGNRMGYDLLPFAELFGGDYLCLNIGKDRENANNPTVCMLSHEESGEFDPVTYHVTDSFDEFIIKYNIL